MHLEKLFVLGRTGELIEQYFPLMEMPVMADFPCPANDYPETKLDLVQHLIRHPSATYYIRVVDDSIANLGIFEGDLLIVDRALETRIDDILIVTIDGELSCKKLANINGKSYLVSEDPNTPAISLDSKDIEVWGVVIHKVHSFR